jgi:hypothetical protein
VGGQWASSSLTLLRGLTCFAFPAGVFALPSNQQLEAAEYTKSTFTIAMKKSERVGSFIKNLDSSFGFSFN